MVLDEGEYAKLLRIIMVINITRWFGYDFQIV